MKDGPTISEWLTVQEAADYLHLSLSLVYRMTNEGSLEHARFGTGRGTIRIRLAALEQFIEDSTQPRHRKPIAQRIPNAPSAFTHLDVSRLQKAWAEQGVVQPVQPHSACDPSVQQDAGKPS
jgi:excisionase family DNA binding protein